MEVVTPRSRSKRILDPVERMSEILFGLIMALTFTSTISAATAGREEVRTLMFAAIGCNIAWGVVDAVMFVVAALIERGRSLRLAHGVRHAAGPSGAYELIAETLPPFLASALTDADYERLRQGVLRMRGSAVRPTLQKDDLLGAVAVFLLVVLSTFPVAMPFLVMSSVHIALRTSNAIAIALLFASGYLLARYGGYRPWLTGLSMVALGTVLVALTIALGG